MKRHELVQLALKVAALVVAISALAQLPFWIAAPDVTSTAIALAGPLWMLLLAAVTYAASGSIAQRLFPDRHSVTALSLQDGQTLAWAMVGAWTLVTGLQVLVLAVLLVLFRRFLPAEEVRHAWEAWTSPGMLISLGARILLGAALLIGAKGLAELWERVQLRDLRPTVVGVAGRVPAEWLARALAVLGVWLVVDGGAEAVTAWVEGNALLDTKILWGKAAVLASLVRVGLGLGLFALSRRLATFWAGLRFESGAHSVVNGTTGA